MRIAVIPARGGSKRVPRKNIKLFCGQPIISWSIIAAKESKVFDKIIVSTEDAEVAEIAREWGAETPFMRPPYLADDMTGTVPVIAHAVSSCIQLGLNIDWACCIYPCSPLIRPSDLNDAMRLALNNNVDFVYPVTHYAHPVQRAMEMNADGSMSFLHPECELARTQDLDVLLHDAGQFYVGKSQAWLDQKRMHTGGIGMKIPNWRVVDIDTLDDWKRAELIFTNLSV